MCSAVCIHQHHVVPCACTYTYIHTYIHTCIIIIMLVEQYNKALFKIIKSVYTFVIKLETGLVSRAAKYFNHYKK
jgi:hypothetical protein